MSCRGPRSWAAMAAASRSVTCAEYVAARSSRMPSGTRSPGRRTFTITSPKVTATTVVPM